MRKLVLAALLAFALPASAQQPSIVPGLSGGPSYGANTFTGTQSIPRLTLGTALLNTSTCTLPGANCSWLYETGFAFQTNNGASPALHYSAINDQMQVSAPFADDWELILSLGGGGFWGNRNTIHARMQISPSPAMTTLGDQSALYSDTLVNAGTYGSGYGGINTPGAYSQNGWGANHLLIIPSGVKYLQGGWGDELDFDNQAGAILASRVGRQVTILPDTAGTQGIYIDAAYLIANQTAGSGRWQCGYCVGAATASWPIDPLYGTVYGIIPRAYSGTETQGALFGIDHRPLTIATGGEAIAEPNMAVDGNGAVHAAELDTLGVLKGETASVASLDIIPDPADGVTGGLYSTVPSITIQAPPGSGTTALASVSTMTLGRIIGFGSTGSGYVVNNILTGSGTGSAGTQPTFKATAVDANGGITACAVNTVGALTAYAQQAIMYPTGGAGTGAGFNIVYSGGVPISCTPAVTGKNYVVGNTVSSGGTGTPGVLTVDTVDSFGGILTAHMTTAGSLTALPATPTLVTGGAGTGANLVLGFSIATTTFSNHGSGYVNAPPLVTTTQSVARVARFNARMTPVEAPLSINPGGQPVTVGGALSAGSATPIAATDGLSVARSANGVASETFLNNNTGASAQTVIYLGNNASNSAAKIALNGDNNTSGAGASSLTITSAGPLSLGSTNGTTTLSDANVVVSTLSASLPVCSDGSKKLTSTCPAGDLPILIGTTSAIGGGALTPGACAAGTATVTGARSTMVATGSPSSDPDSVLSTGIAIYSFVSANDTVTVRICAIVAVTPASVTYNVRVIQ